MSELSRPVPCKKLGSGRAACVPDCWSQSKCQLAASDCQALEKVDERALLKTRSRISFDPLWATTLNSLVDGGVVGGLYSHFGFPVSEESVVGRWYTRVASECSRGISVS